MHKTIIAFVLAVGVLGLAPAALSDDMKFVTKEKATSNAQMQGEGMMNHGEMSGMEGMMEMMKMMRQMEPMMERCNEMMAAMREDHDSKSQDSREPDGNS